MADTPAPFDANARLAEAEELLAEASALAARYSATEAALNELSTVWNDPKAAEYRSRFEESRADIAAFVKGSTEYVAFLRRLAALEPRDTRGRAESGSVPQPTPLGGTPSDPAHKR